MTIATILLNEKYYKKAEEYYNEALSNLRQSTPIDHQPIAKCLTSLGRLQAIYKNFQPALPYLLEALTIYRQCSSLEHVNSADVCNIIALCYERLNQPAETLNYFN
ncbi:unnamed protein product [Rotaria sordida]|uniref:Tetratricopeptide repeat protein n=1 Tax=Rotaria sordida TaxID=392033 RepID=A0A820P0Y7_9BILA|nr:unnamed protein product [Rotaria sordida]